MIPFFFKANATKFDSGANGRLDLALSCLVREELNGAYELNMSLLRTDENVPNLEVGSIIVVKPNQTDGNQPFVVEQITKNMDGTINVYATHIAQNRAKLIPVRPFTATTLAQTLTRIKSYSAETNPFTLSTDKTVSSNFKISEPHSMREIMGGMEGSVLDTYGGEWYYNGWNIELLTRRGRDASGIKVMYGRNMTDYQQTNEFSWDHSITGVLPFYKKTENDTETIVVGDVQYSSYVDYYAYHKTIAVDFSEEFEDVTPTKAQLNAKAVSWLTGRGLPNVSISASFEDISTQDAFSSLYDQVNHVQLGDTVTIINSLYNVQFTSRVRQLEYDVLRERYETIQIGDEQTTINDAISGAVSSSSGSSSGYTAGTGITIANNTITNKLQTDGGAISGNVYMRQDKGFYLQDDIAYEPAPSTNQYGVGVRFQDSTPNTYGVIQGTALASDQLGITMSGLRSISGTTKWNTLRLLVDADGNPVVVLSDAAWRKAMKVAETIQKNETITMDKLAFCAGMTGGSATTIYFSIPLSRAIDSGVSSVSFTKLLVTIKGIGGQILASTDIVADSTYSYTAEVNKTTGNINVTLTGFSGLATHRPVTVQVSTGTSFKFS